MLGKVAFQKQVISEMIHLYVRRKLHLRQMPPEYVALEAYCLARLDACKFADAKPKCVDCKVHCYEPAMRKRVKEVMRWAGPWMLLYHPVDTFKYMFVYKYGK